MTSPAPGSPTSSDSMELSEITQTTGSVSQVVLLDDPNSNKKRKIDELSGSMTDLATTLRLEYGSKDKGPFIVFLESTINTIGKLQRLTVSKKLTDLGITKWKSLVQSGVNRIKLEFDHPTDANSVVNNKLLSQINLKAYIPQSRLTVSGVIKDIDLDISDEELLQGLHTTAEYHIVKVRRMIRKDKETVIPLSIVVITFEGKQLPTEVKFGNVICPIEVYIPGVVQCNNCLRLVIPKNSVVARYTALYAQALI